MPVKILYLIESLGSGGAESALVSCLRFLDRSRFEPLVCPLDAGKDHWRKSIEDLGIKIVTPALTGRWDLYRGIVGLRELIAGEKIDLIHSQLYDANIYGRLLGRSLRLPVITSIQSPDYEPEVWREDKGQNRAKVYFFRQLDKYTGRKWCLKWIAVSEFVRNSAVAKLGIHPSQIEIISNSIDFRHFSPQPAAERSAIRRELGADDNAVILLYTARLHPPKGHQYLLTAMPAICRAHKDVHLLLVGAGSSEYRSELEHMSQTLGIGRHVRFLGVRRDIRALLSGCDLFVFPSLYEGLPVALLEALAMERACVASGIPPVEEVIRNGQSGILVAPRNPGELSDAVIDLISDCERRRKLGRNGRAFIESRFDIRETIRATEALYLEVIRDRSTSAGRSSADDRP
jgi:glycosyltransferase involved in cell wall biosynthesis